MKEIRSFLFLLLLLLLLMNPVLFAQKTAYSPWPMLGGDPQYTHRGVDAPPAIPELVWEYSIKTSRLFRSPPIIGINGNVYVTTGLLKSLNISPADEYNGVNWEAANPEGVHYSPAVGADGTIYVASDPGLAAINTDGSVKWISEVGQLKTSPVVGPDGSIYAGTYSEFYAFAPDGSVKWSFADGFLGFDPKAAIGHDGTVYCVSKYLYAFTPDGEHLWEYITERLENFGGLHPAIGDDGTIYIASSINKTYFLYAIRPDGTVKWKIPLDEEIDLPLSVGYDGTVYAGRAYNSLYAINPGDGAVKWVFPEVMSPATIGYDGTIYLSGSRSEHNEGWHVYALHPDGSIKWKHVLDVTPNEPRSAITISKNGTLYVPTRNRVYAFAHEAPALVAEQPIGFRVNTPYPNPFNASVTIEYVIPHGGHVQCAVYDLLGRKVAVPQEGILSAGTHRAVWNGRDATGRDAASGTYFYRIEAAGLAESGKIMLLR